MILVLEYPQEYTGPSVLYNWYTATAGARSENNATDGYLLSQASGEAADSVCPKGWRLPTNGDSTTNKSYGKLVYTYTGATGNSGAQAGTDNGTTNARIIGILLEKPLSFIYSDFYNYSSGALHSRPLGHYWSSTVSEAAKARNLNYLMDGTGRYLGPQSSGDKGHGFAVRCVSQ